MDQAKKLKIIRETRKRVVLNQK